MKSDILTPLVSVIMPTYNHAEFIIAAIHSVLAQSYSNLELIIVDNYSVDNTKEIVESFSDNRIRYYLFHNKGVIAASRNFGVSQSSGSVIAFLDSDDIWEVEKLQVQLPHMALADICCVSTDYTPIGEVMYYYKQFSFVNEDEYRDYDYPQIALTNPIMTSSLIMKREMFLAVAGFDESPDFRFIEDWELWLRLSREGRVRVLAAPLLKYRVMKKKNRDIRDIAMKTLKIFDKHYLLGFLDKTLLQTVKGNCYVNIGKAFLDANDKTGIIYYMKALRYSSGLHNKVKALSGLVLFFIPAKMRPQATEQLSRARSILFH